MNRDRFQLFRWRLCAAMMIALMCGLTLAAAEDERKAQDALPEPNDLGAEWYWPWDIPRNFTYADYQEQQTGEKVVGITREEWIARFWQNEDPRTGMSMMIFQLDSLTDEEFKEGMAGLLGLMGMVNQEGGEVGATLMPGEVVIDPIQQAMQNGTLTREVFLKHLREQRDNILDVGYADYNRGRANGKPSEIPGYVEHDEDSLSLKIILYNPEYMTKERVLTDVSQATMNKTVADFEKMKEGVKKGRERDAEEMAKEYEQYAQQIEDQKLRLARYRVEPNARQETIEQMENRIAELEKAVKKIEDEITRLLSFQSQVRGAPLQNADGGYLIWYDDSDSEQRDAMVLGKVRLKNVVLEFTLMSEGLFAEGAPTEMQRVINLMVDRLKEFGVDLPDGTAVSMDMMRSTGSDFMVQPENLPPELAAKRQGNRTAENGTPGTRPADRNAPSTGPGSTGTTDQSGQTNGQVSPPAGTGGQAPAQPPVAGSEPDMSRFGELLWSNQLGPALTEIRRLSEQNPNHPMVGVARIGLEIQSGNVAVGRQTAETLLRLYPDNPHLLIARGQAAYWSNDKDEKPIAKQMFERALKINPNLPGTYYSQAIQFYDRKIYTIAYQQFATVAAMSPNQMWMSRYYLGASAEWLGNPRDAVTQYEEFLKQNPPADWANAARANLQRLRQNQR